jgi:hypothetical protein
LEEFEDYITYSNIQFKGTGYSNSWFLLDPAEYKTVMKQFDGMFERDKDSTSTIKHGPKTYQAEIGIFEDDDRKGFYTIILEVGDGVKKDGDSWVWNANEDSFGEGKYILKLRMTPEAYMFKM